MRPPVELPKVDPAEAKRLDEEFVAEYHAGTLPTVEVPPLDPESDPFGRGYAWLKTPATPFDEAYYALVSLPPAEWSQRGGPELRRVALAGSLASGTDEELYRKWVRDQFTTLCLSAGEEGQELLQLLKAEGELTPAIVYDVAMVLESYPEYANLTAEQRIAAALIAVETLRPKPPG